MEPLMYAEVRGEGFRKERIPIIRTSPDRAHVKNLPPRKQSRNEYEEEKKKEEKKKWFPPKRTAAWSVPREKERKREKERG